MRQPSRLFPSLSLVTALLVSGGLHAGCGSSDDDDTSVVNNVVMSPNTGTTLASTPQHQYYERRFSVSSGGVSPYSYTELANGLPAGLYLVAVDSSGLAVSTSNHADVEGFPEQDGLDSVEFRITDGNGDASDVKYELTITPVTSTRLSLSPLTGSALPDGAVGSAYGPTRLTIGNGSPTYSWRVSYGALPSGLTLAVDPSGSNTAEAEVRGTPTTAGTWIFAIEVSDGASPRGQGGGVYQLTIR